MKGTIIKIIVIAVLVVAAGFGSYKGVIALWGEDKNTVLTESREGDGSKEARGKKIKNMLVTAYYYDNYSDGTIEYVFVRYFNVNTKEVNFVFFPRNTRITLSDSAYKEISRGSSNVKQNTLLSEIGPNFPRDEDRYRYTKIALEDVLGTKIDHYEAITSDAIVQIINLIDPVEYDVPKDLNYEDDKGSKVVLKKGPQTVVGDQVKGMITRSDLYKSELNRTKFSAQYVVAYMSALTQLGDRQALGDFLANYFSLVYSDTDFMGMQRYMDYLYQIKPDNLHFVVAPVDDQDNREFILKEDQLKEITAAYEADARSSSAAAKDDTSDSENVTTEEAAATEDQAASESEVTTEAPADETTEAAGDSTEEATTEAAAADSKDLKIDIYNSTTINGLAARWKSKLKGEGYNIGATETDQSTKLKDAEIWVSEDGQGEDLKTYFPDAQIKKVDRDRLKGADIRIVLGTNDSPVR